MTLTAHLVELRKRLMVSAAAILLAMVVGFIVSSFVLDLLRVPVEQLSHSNKHATLNYTNVTSAFDLRMQIALTVGIILACPVWLYELWAFLMPGLRKQEKRYIVGFLGAAIPLFVGGCLAGYWVMPHVVSVMASFAPTQDSTFLVATDYYQFVLKLIVVVGAAFVLPVVLVLLNFAGVLSAAAIAKAWRWAILAIVLFTAIATPAADVVSMFLLAIPMVALYLLALLVAWLHDRRVARRERARLAAS